MRTIKFTQAIWEATDHALSSDPTVHLIGLGVPDPKGLFGTTAGLQKKHGAHRVMDMPTSENAMTGVAIGMAIRGLRPILTHQRVDFALLSLDQIINNAAKWHYMFGSQASIPLVIRMLIGRGWGQGPQHSQTLHGLFAHIPGLKVVMPSSPYDGKGLLLASIRDNNPVLFLEHRWLHNITGEVPEEAYEVPLGQAKVLREGTDLTVVASSLLALEAWKALPLVDKEVSVELIDLRTIRPFDRTTLLKSIRKTGRLLVLDQDWKTGGFAAEILAFATEEAFSSLKCAPARLTYPDYSCPTSWKLSNPYYPGPKEIALKILEIMQRPTSAKALLSEILAHRFDRPLDVPDPTFTGPF